MANEKRLIDANTLKEKLQEHHDFFIDGVGGFRYLTPKDKARVDEIDNCIAEIVNASTVDAVEVVRCQNCVHAEPLDRNCELSTTYYLHCKLWRGDETKNVWHKYKKYYKDYSLVERDGYCDAGEKMDGGN